MMPPWFETELITRGTEIDPTATVGMPVFLRYFEHLRWRLMTEEALALTPLIDAGHFFVVRSQTVELRQRVGMDVRLRMRTRLDGAGRSTAHVLHEARDARDDSLVARARVLGVWLGPERRMARLSDHFRRRAAEQRAHHRDAADHAAAEGPETVDSAARVVGFGGGTVSSFIDPPRVLFEALSLGVEAPSEVPPRYAFEHLITVPPRELDVFSHVNAATWLTYADDARHAAAASNALEPSLATGYAVRTAIFYAREARCHDVLRVALAPLDGPLSDSHALGAWFFRADEPEPLCVLRVDLAPGARPVTAPGA